MTSFVAPIGSPNARFQFETYDNAGNYQASIPYRNAQGEFMLGINGAQMRCEIPYRGYDQVTPANIYPGKHLLYVYDLLYDPTKAAPIFIGKIWDVTASSSTGVLSVQAQDSLSEFGKRKLAVAKTYSGKPEDAMFDLYTYAASVAPIPGIASAYVASNGTKNLPSLRVKAQDRNIIADMFADYSAYGDGVEFYIRNSILYFYGGKIKPSAKVFVLEYGGSQLDGYSVQVNAQGIGNDYDMVSNNNRVGNAVNTAAQTEYGTIYQIVDRGTDLTSTTSLNAAAATALKSTARAKIIPSVVTHALTPIKDFDFGDQFQVVINDGWVQVNQLIRVTGWQLTIGQGDLITTVIYTKDTAEVS